ncbi:MAG: S41 family peptidase, partial [Bacteroidota bacterium]
MKARIFIWVLNLFLIGPINGQKKIDKSYLSKDLDVLKVNLETYHTGLYTYTSKKEFDDWFVKTKSSLEDISAQEFFGKINELNALIKNGHTFFHLNAAQRDKDLKMPCFSIYKFKDSFYIKSVQSKPYENIVGKQLLSLNGVSINKVFDHLLKYKKRDGSNTTQPVEELLHSFPNIYALEYGVNDYTTIEIYDKTDLKEVRLLNIPFQISESKTDMNYEKGGIEYNIENDIAYLNIPTFYLKPLKKERYASKLKKFFGEIQNQRIEHLIIDVRNNGG